MAIEAYQNINEFPISIAGLTNELSVTVPTLKYIAGNYDSYVGVIPGFIKAADDYLTLPLQDVVYVAVPWQGGNVVVTLGTDITGNWTSGVQSVGGTNALRVQVRGTGFDGSIDISQGDSKTAMMVTKQSGALTGYTAATEYYDFRPSAYVKVDITLSAGVIDEVLLAWSGRW